MADNPDMIWLTYDEAAARLGILPDSVRRRAASRKWPRRSGNDGKARVGIPNDIIPADTPAPTPDNPDVSEELRTRLASAEIEVRLVREQLEDMKSERDIQREMLRAVLDDMRDRKSLWQRLFRS